MELADFPSEILAEILSYEPSSALTLSLWKCGNVHLQHRLSNTVATIDLKDEALISTSRFPQCISRLKNLCSLTLSRGKWPLMSTAPQLSAYLRTLRLEKLETLSLTCEEYFSALEDFGDDASSSEPTFTVDRLKQWALWNLSESFPKLTTLIVDAGGHPKMVNQRLLSGLPNTLTRLRVPQIRLMSDSEHFMSLLPRDLLLLETILDVHHSFDRNESSSDLVAWQQPPPMLHTIRWVQLAGVSSFKFLPQSLTMADIHLRGTAWTPALIASLPPGFAKLDMDLCNHDNDTSTHFDATKFLPPLLQSLSLSSSALAQLGSSPSLFAALPRTLTEFKTDNSYVEVEWPLKADSFSMHHFWPSGLVYMNLAAYNLVPPDLQTLPSTLTSLHLRWSSEEPLNLAHLPRCLTLLHIVADTHLTFQGELIKSLIDLSIGAGPVTLQKDLLSYLPSTLRQLSVYTHSCAWRRMELPIWPSHLTKLEMDRWSFDEFKMLPRTLKSLALWSSNIPTGFVPALGKDYFEDLPVSLEEFNARSFTFEGKDKVLWSGNSFSKLVNLHSIWFPASFEPSLLKTLSDKLPKLRILYVLSIALTASYAPLIPQRLQTLRIDKFEEHEMELWMKHWPPASIDSVTGLFSPITSEAAKDIAVARLQKAEENARTYPASSLCN